MVPDHPTPTKKCLYTTPVISSHHPLPPPVPTSATLSSAVEVAGDIGLAGSQFDSSACSLSKELRVAPMVFPVLS